MEKPCVALDWVLRGLEWEVKTNRYIERAGEAEILEISIHIDRECVREREALERGSRFLFLFRFRMEIRVFLFSFPNEQY